MKKPKAMQIVFLDRNTISPQTQLRRPAFAHQWLNYGHTPPEAVPQRIAQADIVVVNKVRLTAQALEQASRLKLIAMAATGTDNVDLTSAQAHNIVVSNIRNYAVRSVPEHTFSLIFALRRSICAYRDAVCNGRWQQAQQFCFFDYPIKDLAHSTLGVIGDGILGQAVASMGRALGMRVLLSAHKGRKGQGRLYTPFEEVLAQSDILTLHCPLNNSTRNMIGMQELQRMTRRPLLINTARGGLVDETAVGPALKTGLLSGAAFDVVSVEPPPADHPFMHLLHRPDFILTPHIAWASTEAMQTMADQLIDNIEAFCAGMPKNRVV